MITVLTSPEIDFNAFWDVVDFVFDNAGQAAFAFIYEHDGKVKIGEPGDLTLPSCATISTKLDTTNYDHYFDGIEEFLERVQSKGTK